MPLSSTTGLLIALMVLVPGGIGDVLMRKLTRMPRPHSDFRQVLSAMVWSVAALVLVELVNSAVTAAAFGDYLIVPAGDVGSSQAAVSLAGRYLVFTAVAITLPAAARMVGCFVIERFAHRTLDEPTIDRLMSLMPKQEKRRYYARIQLEDELIEGFVDWATEGDPVEDAAYIIKAIGKQTRVWVPVRHAHWVMLVDPDDWPDLSQVDRPSAPQPLAT